MGSPIQRRELILYIRYVVRREQMRSALQEAMGVLGKKRAVSVLPSGLSLAFNTGQHKEVMSTGSGCDFPLHLSGSPNGQEDHPLEITLATQAVRGSDPPWMLEFEDPEDRLAAHRFGWVIPMLASGLSHKGLAALGRMAGMWKDGHPFEPGAEGWDSYSISERIVHWIFLASALSAARTAKWEAMRHMLAQGIQEHAGVLRSRLELRGESTNNHLLNNGRALYCAGAFLGDPSFQATGREVLEYGARHMFTPSGFLREGSSHYHILLCRSYLEVFWYAAKSGDGAFHQGIRDRVRAMVEAAGFLLDGRTLHLIGDISPDFRPDFHAGVADTGAMMLGLQRRAPSGRGLGWHSLFGLGDSGAGYSDEKGSGDVCGFDDAGYYRVAVPPITLTLYLNPLGYVPAWSHGHGDLGGFVLDWGGHPLFVDCGRATYRETALGRYGRSVRSHNAIAIDGHEPCVTHGYNGYVPPMVQDYCGPPPLVRVERRSDGIRVWIQYAGFRRLHEGLIVTRTFEVARNALTIIDEIGGDGLHWVETFFHVHPDVKLISANGYGAKFAVGDTRIALAAVGTDLRRPEILRGQDGDRPTGWFTPSYGVRVPTVTVCWRQQVMLPTRNTYIITDVRKV
jgi:hypothetical protein